MTLMATEKPARIHLKSRHPITGRKPWYRDWWFEHDGVVFHLRSDRLRSTVWTIEPDLDHLEGGQAMVDFVRSSAYWCAVTAGGLTDARAKLAEFIACVEFAALRDSYVVLPVQSLYRKGWR